MARSRVFMTGAAGNMGSQSLRQLLAVPEHPEVRILLRDSKKNRSFVDSLPKDEHLEIIWGDLLDYPTVLKCVKDADLVLHIAAFISPAADCFPAQAMKNNYRSTVNLVNAIQDNDQNEKSHFVFIGTVAMTGDRMPPIHWGRVGDPLKPSMFDYYAVSKVAAERFLIESDLKHWVSLRQTGIMGPVMAKVRNAIQFHNCFDNVLEYVSERDAGRLIRNLCMYYDYGTLPDSFWGHIYNIGGGEPCRVDTYTMYKKLYGEIGIKNLDYVLEPKVTATRNFHGQYYLDSDKLEDFLHFRSDSMQYFYDAYLKELGAARPFGKVICKFPGGQRLMGTIIKATSRGISLKETGTRRFIRDNMEDHIDAFWGSKSAWKAMPKKVSQMQHFTDWNHVIHIDHGYDESKPESELNIEDIKKAAQFRGGSCIAQSMETGNWKQKLTFRCAFGHQFEASPRLILEGGHWCPICERQSWNYGKRAKVDPFFAQVWNPLHGQDELREYPKIVNEEEL